MTYRGTFQPNRRSVVTTAPDCIVFVNGEPSLPSGAHPNRRINLQPLISSVSVDLSVDSPPGTASLSLEIPRHYREDFYRGGKLILTFGMEVQIFIKGHYLVEGSPKYYPAFWGLVTSTSSSWSGGQRTVSLSCQDILWWWQNQKHNINASYLAMTREDEVGANLKGHYFTGMNPFSIIYTLSRHVYGDSVNVDPAVISGTERRSEAPEEMERQMMAYWSKKWGRIAHTLRMLGPKGEIIQGDRLSQVLKRTASLKTGKSGKAYDFDPEVYLGPDESGIDLTRTTPFTLNPGNMGVDVNTSEFASKLQIAQTTAEAIGYEFFMDTTGELVFKPPFYNLDVRPNKPVSWVRDIDIISQDFSENPPEFTWLEGQGSLNQALEVNAGEQSVPKAIYVDYELVLKYGWRQGDYSSKFIGATSGKAGGTDKHAMFFHLINKMDKQRAQIHEGSVSIPIRPELRLGYPVFIPNKDSYFYVSGISHSFEYGGQCTTDLTLSARRSRFYAPFESWRRDGSHPKDGETASTRKFVTNLASRPVDPETGTPEGDRNVRLSPWEKDTVEGTVDSFLNNEVERSQEGELSRLADFRTQFAIRSTAKRYVYSAWPSNSISTLKIHRYAEVEDGEFTGNKIAGGVFPVSDNRGYEHVGAYAYGVNAQVSPTGIRFVDEGEGLTSALEMTFMEPETADPTGDVPELNPDRNSPGPSNEAPAEVQIDPNNYGRQLSQVEPHLHDGEVQNLRATARGLASQVPEDRSRPQRENPSGATVDRSGGGLEDPNVTYEEISHTGREHKFRFSERVASYRSTIREVKDDLKDEYPGVTKIPDAAVLAVIHRESAGNPDLIQRTKDGDPVFFGGVGLLQIQPDNAGYLGRDTNRYFLPKSSGGNAPDSETAAKRSIRGTLKAWSRVAEGHGVENPNLEYYAMIHQGSGFANQYRKNVLEGSMSDEQFFDEVVQNDLYEWSLTKAKRYGSIYQSAIDAASGGPSASDSARGDAVAAASRIFDKSMVVGSDSEGQDVEERLAASEAAFRASLEEMEQERTSRFRDALSGRGGELPAAIPSDLPVPRNPEAMGIVSRYLRKLHERAFERWETEEAVLRGEAENVPTAPDLRSVPQSEASGRRDVRRERSSKTVLERAREESEATGRSVEEIVKDKTDGTAG